MEWLTGLTNMVRQFTCRRAVWPRLLVCFLMIIPATGIPRESPEAPVFTDVTRAAGIDFHLTCGSPQKLYIMETMCGGVAFIDYDNDGWPDIFLVNGSTLEDSKTGKGPASKLYHNLSHGFLPL